MTLFLYRIWQDDEPKEVERSYYARSEGEAFRCVERDYPSWYSVELIHSFKPKYGWA